MSTPLKRSWILGAALSLLLAGFAGPGAGLFAVSPALAQDRHDDRDHHDDRGHGRHDYHPDYYRPTPVYAPPAVVVGIPGPSPALDFVFPISIR